MSSPFSVFFRNLRLRHGLRQHEMAAQLGYEQAYLSAIELGSKSPSEEFLGKLVEMMGLSEQDQTEMNQAIKESRRRYVLPAEVPTDVYRLCSELWENIDQLYPAQVRMIREAIKFHDEMAAQPRYQPGRIRRRVKESEVAKM